MEKSCVGRKSKNNSNVYTKPELIALLLSQSTEYNKTQLNKMKKDELCKLLKIKLPKKSIQKNKNVKKNTPEKHPTKMDISIVGIISGVQYQKEQELSKKDWKQYKIEHEKAQKEDGRDKTIYVFINKSPKFIIKKVVSDFLDTYVDKESERDVVKSKALIKYKNAMIKAYKQRTKNPDYHKYLKSTVQTIPEIFYPGDGKLIFIENISGFDYNFFLIENVDRFYKSEGNFSLMFL